MSWERSWEEAREQEREGRHLALIQEWFEAASRIHWAEMETQNKRGVSWFLEPLEKIRDHIVYQRRWGRHPNVWFYLERKMYQGFFAWFGLPVRPNGCLPI